MTADKSMTTSAEIVAKAMIEEHSDFLKESAAMIARQAALRVAESIEGDDTTVWLATRSLYRSDIPTD